MSGPLVLTGAGCDMGAGGKKDEGVCLEIELGWPKDSSFRAKFVFSGNRHA